MIDLFTLKRRKAMKKAIKVNSVTDSKVQRTGLSLKHKVT